MNGSGQATVISVALEWSSTAWLTQPGPRQLSQAYVCCCLVPAPQRALCTEGSGGLIGPPRLYSLFAFLCAAVCSRILLGSPGSRDNDILGQLGNKSSQSATEPGVSRVLGSPLEALMGQVSLNEDAWKQPILGSHFTEAETKAQREQRLFKQAATESGQSYPSPAYCAEA